MLVKKHILFYLILFIGLQGVFAVAEELNTQAVKAPHRLLMDIKQIASNRLVAVGERGHILVSDDAGQNWQQKLVPTEALLTKLFFIDEKNGWAIGHEQTILTPTNAVDTCVLQHHSKSLDQPALFDVWFNDPQNGLAVGAYGLYLATTDGGDSWNSIHQSDLEDYEIGFPHFYSLTYQKTTKTLYMAGELGFLAKSEDLGATWQKLDSPYDGSFFNIASLPSGDLLVMGLRGHLFKSSDNGSSWKEIETGTISVLQELVILPEGRLLIVGTDGTQLLSDNMGDSVSLIQRPDRVHLANAVVLNKNKILLVGIQGVIRANFD